MKKLILCFTAFLWFCFAFGQQQPFILQMEDYSDGNDPKGPSNQVVRFGRDFTPKGVMKIPIIFAGFYSTAYPDNGYLGNVWPNDDGSGNHLTVPTYASDNNSLMQIIFQTEAQLNDPQYAHIKNLTRFYYEMSNVDPSLKFSS